MNVVIGANLKRQKVFIDADGNEVKPFTREVVQRAEKVYIPTREEMESAEAKRGGEEKMSPQEIADIVAGKDQVKVVNPLPDTNLLLSSTSPIAQAVKKAIEQQIQNAVQEALKGIDIGKMVQDAVKDAFQ